MQKASGPHPRTAFRDKYLAACGVLALLLCSILGRAQIIQYPNPGAYGQGMHRFVPDSTLYFPTGCGAPSGIAGLNSYGFTGAGQKIRQAAIYADTCGKHVYWFNWTDSSWRKLDTVGVGGGGTGSADSLKRLFVDTGSIANNAYYLGFDSVNRKWKLYQTSQPFTTTIAGIVNPPGAFNSRVALGSDNTWRTFVTPGDTSGKWVGSLSFNSTKDSLIYFKGTTRYAIPLPTDTTNYLFSSATGGSYYLTSYSQSGTTTNVKFYPVRDTTGKFFGWAPDSALILPFSAKVNIADSSAGLPSNYVTQASRQKLSDSLQAIFNAAFIKNGGAATKITVGAIGSRPAASNCQCFWVSATDSSISYDNGGWIPLGKGSSGGGTTIVDTFQVVTSGSTVTVNNGVNILIIDPSTPLTSLAITLPATPSARNYLDIVIGRAITVGNTVVSSLSLITNTGQTMTRSSSVGLVSSGDEAIRIRYYPTNQNWYNEQ